MYNLTKFKKDLHEHKRYFRCLFSLIAVAIIASIGTHIITEGTWYNIFYKTEHFLSYFCCGMSIHWILGFEDLPKGVNNNENKQ